MQQNPPALDRVCPGRQHWLAFGPGSQPFGNPVDEKIGDLVVAQVPLCERLVILQDHQPATDQAPPCTAPVLSATLSQNLLQCSCLQRRRTHPLAIYRVKATDSIANCQQPLRKAWQTLIMALQANRNAMIRDGCQPFGSLNDLADQR